LMDGLIAGLEPQRTQRHLQRDAAACNRNGLTRADGLGKLRLEPLVGQPAPIGHVPLRAAQDFADGADLVSQRSRIDAKSPAHEAARHAYEEVIGGGPPIPELYDERKEKAAHASRQAAMATNE